MNKLFFFALVFSFVTQFSTALAERSFEHRKMKTNIDGSVTLFDPYVKGPGEKEAYWISTSPVQDLAGLCRRYGYDVAVHSVRSTHKRDLTMAVLLGNQVELNEFSKKNATYNKMNSFSVIVCRNSKADSVTVPTPEIRTQAASIPGRIRLLNPSFDWLGDEGEPVKFDTTSSAKGICKLYGYQNGHDLENGYDSHKDWCWNEYDHTPVNSGCLGCVYPVYEFHSTAVVDENGFVTAIRSGQNHYAKAVTCSEGKIQRSTAGEI